MEHAEASPTSDSNRVDSLATQSETIRAQAWQRFQVIRPFLQEGVSLATLARQHAISVRTTRRWVQRYRQGGLAALCRQTRSDSGSRRCLSPILVELVEGLALQTPALSVAAIHRQVASVVQEQGGSIPSYDLIHDIVHHMDPALKMLAQEGSKAYDQAFELLYRREAEAPNAIWQADHTLLDLVLKDDQGVATKPWLTIIIDDYSRAIAGYMLSFEAPSALHTALALRQAIWRKSEPLWQVCGIPAVLYSDHGSDFISKHLEQVCADLKIRAIFSQVGKPRGRGRVERFFNTVNQKLLSRLPGYAPAGFAAQVSPVLELKDLDRAFQHFVLHDYHQQPHSVTGVPPQARWHEGSFLPHMPQSLEQLDLLLLTVAKPRTIRRDGIWFQSLRYIDITLAAYIGERVTVRYDPRDITDIRVYHRDQFLCRAVCQELAGETVSLKDIIQARRRRKRELHQHIDQRQSLVDQLLASSVSTVPPQESTVESESPQPSHNKLKRYYNE
jgi:putative transposase